MLSTFIASVFIVFANIPTFDKVGAVVYIGIENSINIQLNNCNPEEIQLKVNVGSLQKRSDSTYVYIPQGVQDEIKFKLYYKKVLCAITSVSSRMLPEPTLAFEKEIGGSLKEKDLENPGKLLFNYAKEYPDFNKSKILTFAIMLNDKQGVPIYSTTIKGESLDNVTLNNLKKLTKGAIISIDNIITTNINKGNNRYPAYKQINVID